MELEPVPEQEQSHRARPGPLRRIGLLLIAALLWLALNYFGPAVSEDHPYVTAAPQTPIVTPARIMPPPITPTPSR